MITRDERDSDYWPTSRLVISTPDETVRLQQLGIGDAKAIFDIVDADRQHFAAFGGNFADAVDSVDDAITSIARTSPDRLRFGIWEDGQLRGETGLMYRAGGRAEVSYWLGAEHTGKGYATRAQHLLGAWSFDKDRLHTLYANIQVGNIASRGVAERAGFVPGEPYDEAEDGVIQYVKVKL
jgi:RimJ/RimL family protein N-acetyltransferase